MGQGDRPDRGEAFIAVLMLACGAGTPVPTEQQQLLRALGRGLTERDLVGLLYASKDVWPSGLADALEDFIRDSLARNREDRR